MADAETINQIKGSIEKHGAKSVYEAAMARFDGAKSGNRALADVGLPAAETLKYAHTVSVVSYDYMTQGQQIEDAARAKENLNASISLVMSYLGKKTSAVKAKSSAANGKKGGAPKKTYYLLSGEGEGGTWSGPFVTTGRAIRMRAKKEECGGDRWCSIWELSPETDERIACVVNIDNDDMRDVPDTDED
jgi:hypothetical protein